MDRAKRGAIGLLGAAATLLLHSLFFAVAIWGEGRYRPPDPRLPDAMGAGANTGRPDGESGERRIVVHLTPQYIEQAPAPEPVPQLLEPNLAPAALFVTGPDAFSLPPLHYSEEGEQTEASNAEILARTKLAGLYETQIRARIERAWTVPPGHADAKASCRARIRQQPDGRISEVELDLGQCAGSPEWQQSLVTAIFTASPLPAPPHPGVFVDSFSLVFHAPSERRPDSM